MARPESASIVEDLAGTSAGPGRVDLVDGSFNIGDSIDPARGWVTTLGDLAAGAFLEGRDGPCGHTEAAPAVVITQIVGGPTQE